MAESSAIQAVRANAQRNWAKNTNRCQERFTSISAYENHCVTQASAVASDHPFETKVKALIAGGTDRKSAVSQTARNFPDEHRSYIQAANPGKVIS